MKNTLIELAKKVGFKIYNGSDIGMITPEPITLITNELQEFSELLQANNEPSVKACNCERPGSDECYVGEGCKAVAHALKNASLNSNSDKELTERIVKLLGSVGLLDSIRSAIIEQDNVEPVYQEYNPILDYWKDCDKQTYDAANFKRIVYRHPPKDSTDPASKDADFYKQALINIREGNYPNQYNTTKLKDQCKHEKYRWEDCENCIDEYIESVLAAAPTTPKGE